VTRRRKQDYGDETKQNNHVILRVIRLGHEETSGASKKGKQKKQMTLSPDNFKKHAQEAEAQRKKSKSRQSSGSGGEEERKSVATERPGGKKGGKTTKKCSYTLDKFQLPSGLGRKPAPDQIEEKKKLSDYG